MDKRRFLKTALIAGAGTLMSAPVYSKLKNSPTVSSFKQKALGYNYNDLEPFVDAMTMELHYSRHHAGYTKKFNDSVEASGLQGTKLSDIFANTAKYSSGIRNNGGGYFNHNFYWEVMSPEGGGIPKASLMKEITRNFGSYDKFVEKFSTAASTVFGSGWAWLIDTGKELKITQTHNQDNPLMDVVAERGQPLLNIDVWEHAYYLKYQNKRKDYIKAFFNIIDWNFVAGNLEKSRS